jgi:hypothetical protein
MPHLYNPVPYPANTRRCYWDAEYIASQPFCITSKLTEQELVDLAAFEEMKFWESIEAIQAELTAKERDEMLEGLQESIESLPTVSNLQKALLSLGSSNTQTSDGVPSKTTLNRRSFLGA